MLKESIDMIRSIETKTKINIVCAYLTLIFLTLLLMSIFLQSSITFTRPIFLTMWSGMCLSNVAIYWSVVSITDYMNLKEEEKNGKK